MKEAAYTSIKGFLCKAASIKADVLEYEPMSRHTTFKIGGPARLFIKPYNFEALEEIRRLCFEQEIPVITLGNGSNLLVSDKGLDCAVLLMTEINDAKIDGEVISCCAGASLNELCVLARDYSLTGLEFAYGIPGTVGGAVYMNAGAYGGEMKNLVLKACYLDGSGLGEYAAEALKFGYRRSVFTGTNKLIAKIELKLRVGDRDLIDEKMTDLINRRRSRQPLEYPSAGSVFKRPKGQYAGTLIESCGLKGARVGGAMVSSKHAGFIINTGEATCNDVRKLIDKIKNEVLNRTGILLESEIKVVGI